MVRSFSSTVFAMLLVQQLCHAFSSEKAYKVPKYSVSTVTYGNNSNFSTSEEIAIKFGLVIVNKRRRTNTIYTL